MVLTSITLVGFISGFIGSLNMRKDESDMMTFIYSICSGVNMAIVNNIATELVPVEYKWIPIVIFAIDAHLNIMNRHKKKL